MQRIDTLRVLVRHRSLRSKHIQLRNERTNDQNTIRTTMNVIRCAF